jgi:hypothetical protein
MNYTGFVVDTDIERELVTTHSHSCPIIMDNINLDCTIRGNKALFYVIATSVLCDEAISLCS